MNCRLCLSENVARRGEFPVPGYGSFLYWDCRDCRLTFCDPRHFLSKEDEYDRYRQHQNDPQDARYRSFLNQLVGPLYERVPAGAQGLDYGAGPGPTVSVMMDEKGYRMKNYDPCFHPEPSLLKSTYDVITCTETAEHFHFPRKEFEMMGRMMTPGRSWLGIMTLLLDDSIDFENWWYRRDPTHVCFYCRETFVWIGRWLNLRVETIGDHVIICSRDTMMV